MRIMIDDETRIVGTETCWELQRLRNYKGDKKWEPYKWFSTFRQALDEAVHREIRIHPASSIPEAIEAASAIVRRISELIPPGYRPE
jgi:hypothetical protein